MTAPSLELQAAIVSAVEGDAVIMALISGIYDRVPDSPWGEALGYVSFGPEDTVTQSGCVDLHDVSVQLDVWSRRVGRVHCKQILHELRRIMDAIATVENPIVGVGEPVEQVLRDPDGLTMHGVLRYEITMEAHG